MSYPRRLLFDSFALSVAALAETLAESLNAFPLDLVNIVCVYLGFPPAVANATPKTLFAFHNNRTPSPINGVACAPDGRIWACDSVTVQIFNENGDFLMYAEGDMSWKGLRAIAFHANGNAYVAAGELNCILEYTPDGRIKQQIGRGKMTEPLCVAIDSTRGPGVLFVTGHGVRMQSMLLDGTPLVGHKAWGGYGGANWMPSPRGIALSQTAAGEVAVVDSHGGVVQIFDRDGNWLRKLNHVRLIRPTNIAVDSAGNFLVVCEQRGSQRVQVYVYTNEGKHLTVFCNDHEDHRPRCVHVAADGRILVGTQDGRVLVLYFDVLCASSEL